MAIDQVQLIESEQADLEEEMEELEESPFMVLTRIAIQES